MLETEIKLPDEFASTMQQLVAQAEQTIAAEDEENAGETRDELAAVSERLAGLEQTMAAGFAKLASALPVGGWHADRIDENLRALRNTESVNQRLFNSLHEELKGYRDSFLRDTLQKPFIRDLVVLFDVLNLLAEQVQSSGKGRPGKVSQWSANLENAIHSVHEILHRLEVNEIEEKPTVERAFHKVVSFEPAETAEEQGRIVKRLKRGFLWRDQVLRPEEVVALRFD
ncbi:MAG: nucleotide exchange factor GrpE [Chthoniobacterales bacterium]